MNWDWQEYNKEKSLFKSYYCLRCNQNKPCGELDREKQRCCQCCYEKEWENAQEFSNYKRVFASKQKEQRSRVKQLQLLRNYQGCKQCRRKNIDAYDLYEKNKLVCWECLVKKEKGVSSPISFSEQSRWFRKRWGIDLKECLENLGWLPVSKDCADKWLKDKEHLGNCDCLEQESKELVELFSNSLRENKERLRKCACETSEKVRVKNYDFRNYGYTYCEICQKEIKGAGKTGIIKNRNDPQFWGLKRKEKVLCLECIGKYQEQMEDSKKYTFRKYVKRGYE